MSTIASHRHWIFRKPR